MNAYLRFTRLWLASLGLWVFATVAVLATESGADKQPAGVTNANQAELARQRHEAAHRRRRIIMNNDGNDARTPPNESRTYENFLSKRTTALAGTQVDAIFYCSGVFNLYHHHSAESEARKHGDQRVVDWAWELGEKGPDSLSTIVDFGHRHRMEVFWSMRMNDTHDSGDAALLCQWKQDHREYLMGKKGDKFTAGGRRWSAVNYEVPEVREKVFRILRDVATRYDVDGLELDFFRHPVFFKPQMLGQPVTQEQRDLMTELLRRVRTMADETAARRGRPMLIAVRVPDSVEYCSAVGLDLVRWLKEDLVDLMAVSCYFQLNPWKTSVELGHRYGVPVYPCLSEPRFRKWPESAKVRASKECYHGRALDAWNSGADGIYMFNYFNPRSPLWRELGDRRSLEMMDQIYPAGTMSIAEARGWLAQGQKWLNLPVALPEKPIALAAGGKATIPITVAAAVHEPGTGSFSSPGHHAVHGRAGKCACPLTPRVALRLLIDDPAKAALLAVKLNGRPLPRGKPNGKWLDFPISPALLRQGANEVELTTAPAAGGVTILDALIEIRSAHSRAN
jgi:hypothetical protein